MRPNRPRFRVKSRLERVKRRRRVVEFMAGLAPESPHFIPRVNRHKSNDAPRS